LIDPATEQRILDQAVEEGLLTPQDVEEQERDLQQWGPRLAAFLRAGLLRESWAENFLEETEHIPPSGNSSSDPQAGTDAAARERFEMGELLGKGGMGEVYRAYDTSLKRHIALKLLTSDDPDRIARFLREAQAQARIDHENVCKVFEVGEVNGKPAIAMQLLEGQALFVSDENGSQPSPALAQMTIEQRVRMMRAVAEGIHAAHREGLIHRDIKPSNIILERRENGDYKPYVLDFGLAKEVASAGVTSLGLAAGTPSFMAPEQARGDAAALDRRTDVYGLGATAFAILSGHPPFEGPSSLDVLIKVTEQEPPPLTGVPEDLATIVTKCLQKDPAQRYESARALAEDLGRYLDGDPILARRTSLGYRLLKKARKHRRLVAAAGVTALGFVALAAWTLKSQIQARERARLAAVFGQEVKAIESRMRIAHLTREHDLGPEKAAIRERMSALKERMTTLGAAARGPGDYALGRGALALGEYEQARKALEQAWQGGYREREVAYALGQVMGALYQKELEAAARISDEKAREERRKQAERTYRDPALEYLQRSRGLDSESAEYVEALVAFYEKRHDEALAKARAAYGRVPWLYEARDLEARIHAATGIEKADHGDQAGARAAYQEAEAAYAAAQEIGASDPQVSEGQCRLAEALMVMNLYSGDATVEPHFQAGLAACDRALRIDSESLDAYRAKARLLWRRGEGEYRKGGDPRETLKQSIEASRYVLQLRPDDVDGHFSVGIAHVMSAYYEGRYGLDPRANLQEAIRVFEAGLRLDPNNERLHDGVAISYYELASYGIKRGEDPHELLGKAEQAYRFSLTSKRESNITYTNLALTYRTQAEYELEHGQDPSEALRRTREAAEKALAINPRMSGGLVMLASAYRSQAEHALLLGEDPRADIDKAVETWQRLLEVNPKNVEGLVGLAVARWLAARHEMSQGRPPEAALQEGRRWAESAVAADPQNDEARQAEASLAVLEARSRQARGISPEDALARARRAAEQAVRLDSEGPEGYTLLAETDLGLAQWHRHQGLAADHDVAGGLEKTDKALAIDPTYARALAIRGALYLERAEPAKAREAFERAFAIDRFLTREFARNLNKIKGH
jgi:serine/threonine-protein kinase